MFGKSLLINPVTAPMYVKEKADSQKEMVEDFSTGKSKATYNNSFIILHFHGI